LEPRPGCGKSIAEAYYGAVIDNDLSRRNSMSATTNVAAAAAIMVFVAPALGSAQAPANPNPHHQQRSIGNATLSAYAAGKSSRTSRPASRSRVSHATDLSNHVIGPDGHDLGTDPDATIRFQLRRDPLVPGGSGGGGM